MRTVIGEFLREAVDELSKTEAQAIVIEAYLHLLELELQDKISVEVNQLQKSMKKRHETVSDSTLQTLANVLLRFDDAEKWRLYFRSLLKRKKWWDEKDNKIGNDVQQWAKKFWSWINFDEAGVPPENHLVSQITKKARERLNAMFYDKDRPWERPSPPIAQDELKNFIDKAVQSLWQPLLREFMIRWISGISDALKIKGASNE
jgi:hypothetical protein